LRISDCGLKSKKISNPKSQIRNNHCKSTKKLNLKLVIKNTF
jgi:hypothetical protein